MTLLGALVVLALGAAACAMEPGGFVGALRRPSSLFIGLTVLFVAALGLPGLGLGLVVALGAWVAPRTENQPVLATPSRTFWWVLFAVAAWALARPLTPLFWDEFVWLAKARVGSGLSAVVEASLDPSLKLIPPGYVPLWPAAVRWLTLGVDALDAHTLGATLLVLGSFAAALEAWWPRLKSGSGALMTVLVAAPLFLVHLRSTYVDLPVGLLGVAVLGHLVEGNAGLRVICLGVVAAGFKDEGAAHVVAATAAALLTTSAPSRWRLVGPALAAVTVVITWRVLLASHGVEVVDHALGAPQWGWLVTLGRLLLLHATDVTTWGVVWAVTLAVAFRRQHHPQSRALRLMLAGNLVLMTAALMVGPERVRVFAENGTLLNRLLLQSWPAAAMLLVTAVSESPRDSSA